MRKLLLLAGILFVICMALAIAGCQEVRPNQYQYLEMQTLYADAADANEACQADVNDCPNAFLKLREFYTFMGGVDMTNYQRQLLNNNWGGVLAEIQLQDPNTMQRAARVYTRVAETWIERSE